MPITIKEVTDEYILFSDGSKITFDHDQDCCEYNYAQFEALDDIAKDSVFFPPLIFEKTDYGFRFGNGHRMFFVPCYSVQNGYYTNQIDIYYNLEKVLSLDAPEID
jgi:hypothetical protein